MIFLKRLHDKGYCSSLIEYLNSLQLDVGTGCSGTESPIFTLDALAAALKELCDADLDMSHKFSCEYDRKKMHRH